MKRKQCENEECEGHIIYNDEIKKYLCNDCKTIYYEPKQLEESVVEEEEVW